MSRKNIIGNVSRFHFDFELGSSVANPHLPPDEEVCLHSCVWTMRPGPPGSWLLGQGWSLGLRWA